MSYKKREYVKQAAKDDIEYFISMFPKDYSDVLLSQIRQEVLGRYFQRLHDYKDAFCEDNNLCPICITGGFECGSDHK